MTTTTVASGNHHFQNKEFSGQSSQFDKTLFHGRIFVLCGFRDGYMLELSKDICEAGGVTDEQRNYSKTFDYLVVPVEPYDFSDNHHKANEIVTDLWVVSTLSMSHLCL